MPFTVIKGTFVPAAGVPDGDTVRFRPHDTSPLFGLKRRGRLPRINKNNGTISLRYEGIDAVEKDAIEPHASDATNINLELLGLQAPDAEGPGFIMASQVGPNGRPICFVFKGDIDVPDGTEDFFLEVDLMKTSVNYQLVEVGQVYPLFYDTLYHDLREAIAQASVKARTNGLGMWPDDATNSGVTWGGAASLAGLPPIYPKLWRRLEKYTQNRDFKHESDKLDAFKEFLVTSNDGIVILSLAKFVGMQYIVEVEGNVVRIPHEVEDLVFRS